MPITVRALSFLKCNPYANPLRPVLRPFWPRPHKEPFKVSKLQEAKAGFDPSCKAGFYGAEAAPCH